MAMSLNLNSPGVERTVIAAPSPSRQAVRLAALGGILMVALPLAMWAANRSAPLMLGLSAAAFLAAAMAGGDIGPMLRRVLAGLRSPIGLALTAFLGWALVSLLWTHRPAFGFAAWAELLLPLGFALVIAASAWFKPERALVRALAICLILASALMWFELQSGLAQRIALGVGKQTSFIFNRPVIACLVLLAPVAHLLWTDESKRVADRLLAAAAAVAVVGIVLYSESGAAKLGLGDRKSVV